MTNSTTFPGILSCPTSTVSNAMTLGTTKTFVITVSDASGYNKYYIDGYLQPVLELHQGQTYIFDLSSSTLSGHPFMIQDTIANDGSASGTPYTTGITTTGTYASSEKRTFIVPTGAPTTLYYYCTIHGGMGASMSILPTSELVVSGRVKSTDLVVTGTRGVSLGGGTTAERPSNPTTGTIRYNSTTGFMESYLGTAWASIAELPTVASVSPTTTLSSGGSLAGWDHQTNLFHPYPNNGDNFGGHNSNAGEIGTEGVSISDDGTYAIVGARNDDNTVGGSDSGSAQIFKRTGSTWAWQAELHASTTGAQINWYFGWNVNISGDGVYAFVSQYQGQATGPSRSGSVHVFKRTNTTWAKQTELFNPNAEANDNFGYNVDSNSDGSYIIVGAEEADPGSAPTDSGAAQIFKRTNESWAHQATLLHPNPASSDEFGWSVSISGDGTLAVVGVKGDDTGANQGGSAQVYLRNTSTNAWSWEDELLHPPSSGVSDGPTANDYFGQSVAISSDGTRIIVGANRAWDDNPGGHTEVGAAFIFRRETTTSPIAWVHEKELHPYDPEANMYFGFRVSISGDGTYAAVSAHRDGDNSKPGDVTDGGVLHLFKRTNTTWALEKELVNPNRVANDYMGDGGVTISSDATHIITGSPYSVHGASQGSAQIFDLRDQVYDSRTQVFTVTGTGILPGSTVQLEGADGTLYSVVDPTPNAAGTQATFKMGALEAEFPPSAMGTDVGTGALLGYIASEGLQAGGSSSYSPYKAFDDTINSSAYWNTPSGSYSTSSPYLARASDAPVTQDISGTSHIGTWIQLQIPNPVVLGRAIIGSTTASYQHGLLVILGSNDNTNWTLLHAGGELSGTPSQVTTVTTLSEGVTTSFSYFRVVFKSKAAATGGSVNSIIEINNIQFFGGIGEWVATNQPYKISVTAPTGLRATSTATIGLPVVWTTATGTTFFFSSSSSKTNTLVGTDGGGGANRKFEVVGTPTLPSGLTLNESTGAISGQVLASQSGVTTTVTFRLTDNASGLFADREIGISGSSWEILMSTGGFMGASWYSSSHYTAFGSPGSAAFKSATATSTGASGRTAFGDGYGLYNAFFTKTDITRIAIVNGYGDIQNPTGHSQYNLYDLLSGGTGSETIYEIIDRLDTYNLNNASWHNTGHFGSPSVTNFTSGTSGYSGTLTSYAGNITDQGNSSADYFCIWGVNTDSDNDTQVLCAYSGNLGNGKSDSWRSNNPAQTAWSYWGNDWHSNTPTQTISVAKQTDPGRPTGVPYGGGSQYYLMAFG